MTSSETVTVRTVKIWESRRLKKRKKEKRDKEKQQIQVPSPNMSYKEILHRSLNQKLWFSTSNLLIIRYNQWTRHIINPFTYNFRTDCVIKLRTEGGNDSIQFNQRGICCDVCSFFLLNASRIYFKHLFLLNPELFCLKLDPIKWKSNSIIGQNLISLIFALMLFKRTIPSATLLKAKG